MTEEQVDELKNHFDYYFYSEGEEPGFDDEAIGSDIAVTKFGEEPGFDDEAIGSDIAVTKFNFAK